MRNLVLAALACIALTATAQAQDVPAKAPIVSAQLLLHAPQVRAGQVVHAGVLFTIPPQWHIYAQNPGDSGIPTTLEWLLPEGVSAGDIEWPTPERIESSGIVNYGYGEKVILPVQLMPARDGINGEVWVTASWLACKDICIPESVELSASLPQSKPQAAALLAVARQRLPVEFPGKATYRIDGDKVILTVDAPKDTYAAIADFFPIDDGIIANDSEITLNTSENQLTLTMARASAKPLDAWRGILTLQPSEDAQPQSYTLTAQREAGSEAAVEKSDATAPASDAPLYLTLLLALLGGMLLNFMPCVLPILSLKALALAKKSGAEQRAARAQGIAYTLGVVATFLAIAGLMLALKAGGASIGWGFQLQEPAVIVGLLLLMVLVALNLFGLFELPVLLGSAQADTHSLRGAFLTGALAVALATPCSAPFMATAIGATLIAPAPIALAIFAALGLGMALPFLIISCWPAARRLLPKPGVWMLRFKQFLAFPMLATAAWLLWVLLQINGEGGMVVALAASILLALLVWGAHASGSTPLRRVLQLLAVASFVWAMVAQPLPITHTADADTGRFSEAVLSDLRAQGQPVFVNATAAWCITCKINERLALHDGSVRELFAQHNVHVLTADWTARDAEIGAYLAKFGRNGVPLYVYYPARGEPMVLPQLLTPAILRETIAAADNATTPVATDTSTPAETSDTE